MLVFGIQLAVSQHFQYVVTIVLRRLSCTRYFGRNTLRRKWAKGVSRFSSPGKELWKDIGSRSFDIS